MEEIIMKQLAEIRLFSLLAAKNVLDIDDVVALTGLSKSYIYKLTCRKEIPYYKPNGKLIYFDRQEVENWMKQNRVNSIAEAEQVASKYLMEKGVITMALLSASRMDCVASTKGYPEFEDKRKTRGNKQTAKKDANFVGALTCYYGNVPDRFGDDARRKADKSVSIGSKNLSSVYVPDVILFDNVQVPHYNYVGDSILGYKAHMGAGSITSNVKSDKKLVKVSDGNERKDTGMKKMGAILGDNVEIGCNTVLCPGTIVGRNSIVYPSNMVRGTVAEDSIYKDSEHVVKKIKE